MSKLFKTPLLARWIYSRRVWGFSDSNKVYLTFDDGPTPELTKWILNYLKREGVKATFFCVGENVKELPVEYSEILQQGHQVGNHTMRHEKSIATSRRKYLDSIDEASELINSRLFRPPYGRLSLLRGLKVRAKYKVIMWSWLSYDYDREVPIDRILKEAKKIKGGDILVLHDNEKVKDRLKQLLPELIQIIKAKGLEFETIAS